MKIYRFNEYVDNSDVKYKTSFNSNEIKFFRDKSNIIIIDFDKIRYDYNINALVYINCIEVQKLRSGEYYLPSQGVKCTTIQSVIKYTKDKYKEIFNWFNSILSNLKKEVMSDIITNWYYNEEILAQYNKQFKSLRLKKEYFEIFNKQYNLKHTEIQNIIRNCIMDSMNIILELKRITSWN